MMCRVTANQVQCRVVAGFQFQICFELCLYHYYCITVITGAHGGVVVKALRYKPAGHEFDSQWCHWNFSVT